MYFQKNVTVCVVMLQALKKTCFDRKTVLN